jgi:hypothetical protein
MLNRLETKLAKKKHLVFILTEKIIKLKKKNFIKKVNKKITIKKSILGKHKKIMPSAGIEPATFRSSV